jgi:hypothetical protein
VGKPSAAKITPRRRHRTPPQDLGGPVVLLRLVTVAPWTLTGSRPVHPGSESAQIGVELGISSTTVSDQLRRGVTMRRGGSPAHPASTQQILELRDRA